MYERFESRVRTAGRERTLEAFLSKLARRCHVAVPRLEAVDREDMAKVDLSEALGIARDQSGLAVASLRLWIDIRREAKNPHRNQGSLFGGAA